MIIFTVALPSTAPMQETMSSVDTDSCPALAAQYQAQSIPQITAISADSVVANQIGSMSEADFTAYIESLLQ